MSIRWEEVEPQKYEDMVSVLLSRLHPDSQRIDGKGGDGGRDVQIVHGQDGQVRHAFELKSFTGRMKAGRRRQVADSLKRAAALKPAQWTLIVPIDPTPGEDGWFRQIGTECCFPTRWLGKTWLDGKMSEFPDIRRYFLEGTNEEVVRLLRDLQKEKAALTNVQDAIGRVQTLRERLDEIDPHYNYEIATGRTAAEGGPAGVVMSVNFGGVRVDVYPKYSGAVEDRPVNFNIKLVSGPGYEEIQYAINYGLEVTIPPRMISTVTIDAPSGLGGSFTGGEINFLPTNTRLDEPVTLALKVMDGDADLAICPVHLTEQTTGLRGSIVTGADSTGWLRTRIKMDVAAGKIKAEFWLDPKPAMPAALMPLFRWLVACRPPHYLAIRWPGGAEHRSEIRTSHPIDESLGRVVEALAFLQDRSGIYWELPPSLILEEAREIVTAATLLKGDSLHLTWKTFNLNLNQWGPGLEELLNGHQQSIICEQDSWLELEGVKIPLGRIQTHFESARLADPTGVRRALESGSVPRLCLIPGDSNKAQRTVVS